MELTPGAEPKLQHHSAVGQKAGVGACCCLSFAEMLNILPHCRSVGHDIGSWKEGVLSKNGHYLLL